MAEDTPPTDDQDAPPQEPAGDLGDPGKKALDSERKARRDAEKQLRELQNRLKEIEDRDKSEAEKLAEAVAERDAQLAELPRTVRQQAIRFASLATSAGFVDPEDALLNLGEVDLGDTEAIKAQLAELAERKPHLVRTTKPADRLPARPKASGGAPLGTPAGDDNAKERAAAALRALRQ